MARKISGCPNLYLFKKSLRSFKILLHKGTNYKGRFFKMANETENSIHIFKVCFPDFFCLLHNNYFMINPVNILLELHFTVFEMLRFATFFIMPCSPQVLLSQPKSLKIQAINSSIFLGLYYSFSLDEKPNTFHLCRRPYSIGRRNYFFVVIRFQLVILSSYIHYQSRFIPNGLCSLLKLSLWVAMVHKKVKRLPKKKLL